MQSAPASVEARDYTFCQVFWTGDEWQSRTFLIMRARGIGVADALRAAESMFPELGKPSEGHVYPRNYVKDARALYARGLYVV